MKIIYLHQYFNTPDMPGGTRSYEMGRRLVAWGHEVHMITSWREPTDKIGWFSTEEAGIKVHWLPVPYGNHMSYRQRINAFFAFAWKSGRKAAAIQGDVIFATSTPLTIALPGVYAAKRQKIPMVFEVRDLWPELPIAIGALYYRDIAHPSAEITRLCEELYGGFYLATVHRAENTDDVSRLNDIMQALDKIAIECPVVMPLHPRTRKLLGDWKPKAIRILDPVGYFDMITMLQGCRGVFTDSGGLQKEAFFFGKACLVLRDETEWVELVNAGFNALTGTDSEKIIESSVKFFDHTRDFSLPLYGDGHAGERIVETLLGLA